ncbi:MAG: hypothetical protein FJW30_05850 [Acidobacteria bacterium]|nr:hypothetical protein [Acidobacteriota bacterium]
MKTLLLVTAAAATVLSAGTPCGPSFKKIVDPFGNTLPRNTAFIAWAPIDNESGVVFRPLAADIDVLIARLEEQGADDPAMLTAAFWQETRCRIVNDRCTGECPIQDGKKLRCLPQRTPSDPKPPPTPKHKKKHGKTDGMPRNFAQVSSLRCQCR